LAWLGFDLAAVCCCWETEEEAEEDTRICDALFCSSVPSSPPLLCEQGSKQTCRGVGKRAGRDRFWAGGGVRVRERESVCVGVSDLHRYRARVDRLGAFRSFGVRTFRASRGGYFCRSRPMSRQVCTVFWQIRAEFLLRNRFFFSFGGLRP